MLKVVKRKITKCLRRCADFRAQPVGVSDDERIAVAALVQRLEVKERGLNTRIQALEMNSDGVAPEAQSSIGSSSIDRAVRQSPVAPFALSFLSSLSRTCAE